MSTITILAMLVILAGATLSITGVSLTGFVAAQSTGDNATMSENVTVYNGTGSNTTGSISSFDIIMGDGGEDDTVSGNEGP